MRQKPSRVYFISSTVENIKYNLSTNPELSFEEERFALWPRRPRAASCLPVARPYIWNRTGNGALPLFSSPQSGKKQVCDGCLFHLEFVYPELELFSSDFVVGKLISNTSLPNSVDIQLRNISYSFKEDVTTLIFVLNFLKWLWIRNQRNLIIHRNNAIAKYYRRPMPRKRVKLYSWT